MRLAVLALAIVLAGCGFRLRGTAEVPFGKLYIPNANAGLALDLKRNVLSGTNAQVVEDPKQADAILEFTEETREKHILSLTGGGRVREFQLRYRVGFRVHDGRGGAYVPQSTIQIVRDVTFSDADILAKEAEEQLLFQDLRVDMVQQILRRLAAARRPAPPSS